MGGGQGFNSQVCSLVSQWGGLGPGSRRFSPSGFFFFTGDVSLRTKFPPPLEWISSPPLVAAVLITTKGDEPPGSSRVGVIGALVILFPSQAVQDKLHSP